MPRFYKLSPEMQRWSAMLAEELAQWPGVSTKPMFGFTSFYRKGTIFAAVPKTRTLHTSYSVMFKLPEGSKWHAKVRKDPRVPGGEFLMERWIPFELQSEDDLRDALLWFERSFQSAKAPRK
jgi:hypothetical protein